MNQENRYGREALVAGVVFVILAAISVIPLFTLWVVWLMPIPLIVFTVLNKPKIPPLLAVLSAGCLLLSGFGWSAFMFGLGIYFMGWVVGESLRKAESPYSPIIVGTLVMVMLEMVLLALIRFSGVDIFSSLSQQISAALTRDHTQTQLLHLDAQQVQQLAADTTAWIRMMMPSLIVVFAFLFSALNFLLSRSILTGEQAVRQPLLSTWRLPNSVVGVYVLALTFLMFGLLKDQPFWWQTVQNVVFLAGFFLGIQGIAYLWRKLRQSPGRYVWLTLLILGSSLRIVGDVYILLGLIDSANRVRRV